MKIVVLLLSLLLPSFSFADGIPTPWQMYFQAPASPTMHKFYAFHDLLMIVITAITILVFVLLAYVCIRFNKKANPVPATFTHNVKIEVLWTAIPILVLLAIAVPSLKILYYVDKVPQEDMTLKVIGHQWYWEYSYQDDKSGESFNFDSYMIKPEDLQPGQLRLLEVDNRVIVPVNKTIKILLTSADVIHSWAVPALGIKTDTVPGRTNETWVKIDKPGIYYGQCSQLCGFGHGFMPIAVQAVSEEEYQQWFNEAKQKFANNFNSSIHLTYQN
ncbi:cytochrome c oxidase subunit II [Rickettsiales endosymbiont of Stachyamoeba lipophora]|uniref:cytochrome c oxidase subunit II n=1 Tax=Rickettsiales endosymbiont of Stachyamoeba lipophora TaxID=2486578 RepID=UPI000F65600E|nr:cytochrome c oxidase subunit II [Rickettsiales endosymbiont of Stachyamoeba lipophora]AZL15326.1 cytochrome c oxidase subunit II [Rickettsiales endosymbiont of Stachyamoeba lipophora]